MEFAQPTVLRILPAYLLLRHHRQEEETLLAPVVTSKNADLERE
jgi:hypothetical protein